jgi:hypothetical protein
MTLGLIALRVAKEQLAAAIATIKDELQNPELAEQIKFEVYNIGSDLVYNIGSDLDDHLTELGKAMPEMNLLGSAQAAADLQISLLDPTQEHGLQEGIKLVPTSEQLAELESANHNDPESDSNQGHGEPSTEGNPALDPNPSAADLDAVEAEKAVASVTLGEEK